MSKIDLQKEFDDVSITYFLNGLHRLGAPARLNDPLPPRLWEPLRIAMQERYRKATGEPYAVLEVRNAEPG